MESNLPDPVSRTQRRNRERRQPIKAMWLKLNVT